MILIDFAVHFTVFFHPPSEMRLFRKNRIEKIKRY